MRTIVFLLAISSLGLLFSCKDKKPVLTEQKVEIVEEVIKNQPIVEEKAEPAPVSRMSNYYLVAGCFQHQENAERLNTKLSSQGYDSRILPFYNLHMVTYNGFDTRKEAQIALNQIVQEPGKEFTWVYPIK